MLHALADSSRRTVLDALSREEATAGELAALLPIARPGVSRHLRVLREAGLVRARVAEQRRLYRLDSGPLRDLDDWLAPYRAAWDASLDRLARHLDEMDDGTGEGR